MAHLRSSETRAQDTPPEWLRVGAAVGRLVNEWSGRDDLIAYVGKDAGHGAPACYNPVLAEVEVDTAAAFGPTVTPEQVGDLADRSRQYEFPKATGAVLHEAFHARFSRYDLAEAARVLRPDEHRALILLEESRIERHGVLAMPEALPFLRASAMQLAIGDAEERLADEEATPTERLATLVGLVHARVEAGIVEAEAAEGILRLVDERLGTERVAALVAIAVRAQAHELHHWPEPMYDLAREWARLVRETAEERGEEPGGADGENRVPGGPGGLGEEIREALREVAEVVEVANHDRLADQQTDEEWREAVKERGDEARERSDNEAVSGTVFSSEGGEGGLSKSYSELRETRRPTQQERSAAVRVAAMLERAKYRDRDETEIHSAVPPGRLRTRAIVQGAAMRQRGVVAAVEPWRRTVRRHTDDPTLTVGVMVDISGSMSAAMEPMATTAWVLGEAARRVQGRCAMVYYGAEVFPTLRPGQRLDEVRVFTAPDPTEKFDTAFRALDGALDLLHGDGARLLVVVSDGHYTAQETAHAQRWMARCSEAGVAVLWMPFTAHTTLAERYTRAANAVMLTGVEEDPTAAADAIGRAAANALSAVGRAA